MKRRGLIVVATLFLASIALFASAQDATPELLPGQAITFSLKPGEAKSFVLPLDRDGFAEISWRALDNMTLEYGFISPGGKALDVGDSNERDSAIFIAPEAGKYNFLIRLKKESEVTGTQSISLEYKNRFSLPPGSRLKDSRKANGYDVKIYFAPGSEPDFGDSIVLFEKAGKLKKVLKSEGNPTYIGFSFPDDPAEAETAKAKKALALIRNTSDKTGDGVPDIMLDFFSGGAHCCFSTYFVNLGEPPTVIERIDTENASLSPISVNPKGGLRFQTHENAFAYWNIFFAGSPMPLVILEFVNGELRPNFSLTRKRPPALAVLRTKAKKARLKINDNPYDGIGMDFEEAFWDEMLDLIYTGNEELAWQYFDLVWPVSKPGKERFLTDFKEQLALSYYGTRNTNSNNSFRNYMRLFEQGFKNRLK